MIAITIDNTNLEEQIKLYKKAIEDDDSAIRKMNKIKSDISSSWPGDAGVAFLRVWENYISNVEKEKENAQKLIDLLNKIIKDAGSQDIGMSSMIDRILAKGGNKIWH